MAGLDRQTDWAHLYANLLILINFLFYANHMIWLGSVVLLGWVGRG